MQLEKTPAAFGKRKLPSLDDIKHLMDYVTYRLTRSNVGPWGLSAMTERRPMYLSPDLAVPISLPPPVAESLATALRRISAADDTTAVSRDLAGRFRPPGQADPANELGQALSGQAGLGLFGNSRDADSMLAAAERSALITRTRYSTQGVGRDRRRQHRPGPRPHNGRLHLFSRDPANPAKLVPSPWKGSVQDTLATLLT